jgi:hypothetical protein
MRAIWEGRDERSGFALGKAFYREVSRRYPPIRQALLRTENSVSMMMLRYYFGRRWFES